MREKFREIKTLGAGGFARTCLVEILSSGLKRKLGNKEVVIKIPHDRQKEKALIQELVANASLKASLERIESEKTKHIIKYLGFETYRDGYVIIFEYVKGQDLSHEIKRGGAFDLDRTLKITKQICRGLSVIHEYRILHRDIKPENILMTEQGVIKIADLGVSAILSSDERASTTAGTIFYMAPEILIDNQGCFASDVYSTGVMMYEMATGRLPFYGESMGVIIKAIERGCPIPPKEFNQLIDPELNNIILKSIQRQTSRRYSSATEFLKAIELYESRNGKKDSEVEKLVKKAMRVFKAGQKAEAVNELKEIVKAHPSHSQPYLRLGEVYNRTFAESDAMKIFLQGIDHNPDCGYLHRDLALIYYNQSMRTRNRKSRTHLSNALEHLHIAIDKGMDEKSSKNATTLLHIIKKKQGSL